MVAKDSKVGQRSQQQNLKMRQIRDIRMEFVFCLQPHLSNPEAKHWA